MYKDISVVMTGTDGDDHALKLSIPLARHFNARLLPWQVVELPDPSYNTWAIVPDPSVERVHEKLRHAAAELAGHAKALLTEAKADSRDVHVVEALYVGAWEAATRECFGSDLIVVGRPDRSEMLRRHAQGVATLLLQSGRPVLMIPAEASLPAPPKSILVAWRPAAEATRALHDALPFLQAAEAVHIMAYDDMDAHEPERRHALLNHLRRHGVNATSIAGESQGADLTGLIFAHARKVHADLIVAGGYGHSRLRERVLGGVTQDLLLISRAPVFLSH